MLQNATWITTKEAFSGGVPLFRRDFSTDGAILSATLYITAFGLYEAVLNGERVGEFVLAPGWTSYNKRLQYQCYDVTGLLQADNTLTVTLGNGWCTGPITWNYKKGFYTDLSLIHI